MTHVRLASPSDVTFVTDLEKQFADTGLVGSDSRPDHEQRMAGGDAAYLIVEHDGQPAGFVILCGLRSMHRNIELKRIIVSEPGDGVGREALRLVERMVFRDLSAHRLWLDVYSDNERARRAYRAAGFVEEGMMRDCVWSGDRFRSMVLMSILDCEFQARE